MGNETPDVYDPDATDRQIRDWDRVLTDKYDLKDFAKPEALHLILQQSVYNLTELKAARTQIEKAAIQAERLRIDREGLRIQLARSSEQARMSWVEIPVSILSGFAINMLTTNSGDGLGWALLLLSLVIIGSVRSNQLSSLFSALAKLPNREVKDNG